MTISTRCTLALLLGALALPAAQAKPPFAQKEGKSCVYCHNSPAGGARNYRGQFYGKNGLSFAGFDDAAEAKKAGVPVGPEASPNPKSWSAPAGGGAAPAGPKAGAPGGGGQRPGGGGGGASNNARSVATAKALYDKNPTDEKAINRYAYALADYGMEYCRMGKKKEAQACLAKIRALKVANRSVLNKRAQLEKLLGGK